MGRSDYQPTDEQRKLAHRPVLYELRMLRFAVAAFCKGSPWGSRAELGSALRDSALLHARNLYDFLTHRPSRRDDIVAGHFASNEDGSPWSSSGLANLDSILGNDGKANKARHHLTYSRLGMKSDWDLKPIQTAIEDEFREFVFHVTKDERTKWLESGDSILNFRPK